MNERRSKAIIIWMPQEEDTLSLFLFSTLSSEVKIITLIEVSFFSPCLQECLPLRVEHLMGRRETLEQYREQSGSLFCWNAIRQMRRLIIISRLLRYYETESLSLSLSLSLLSLMWDVVGCVQMACLVCSKHTNLWRHRSFGEDERSQDVRHSLKFPYRLSCPTDSCSWLDSISCLEMLFRTLILIKAVLWSKYRHRTDWFISQKGNGKEGEDEELLKKQTTRLKTILVHSDQHEEDRRTLM
jgi:hypothetical protein